MPVNGQPRARRQAACLVLALVAAMTVAVLPSAPAAADGNEAPGAPLAIRSITAGFAHTCALLDDATVRCWGYNGLGQLGQGDSVTRGETPAEMGDNLPAVDLGTGRTATAISGGDFHTCAVLDNGTVKCWGYNLNGQLGLGDVANRGDGPGEMGDGLPAVSLGSGRTATAITTGGLNTCALLDNATVKCWGHNNAGQLGQGDGNTRGDDGAEMGDFLPAIDLGTGRTAAAVAAGASFACALLDNATVKCWGENSNGRLGLGTTTAHGDVAGTMGDSLPAVALGTGRTATAIATGDEHACALLDNATVKCWGANGYGQSGLGDTNNRGNNAGEMGDDLPAVSLGTGRTATAITGGSLHTCARLDDATVKCWGFNFSGQLGLGDIAHRGDSPAEMGDSLPAVDLGTGRTATAVTAGGSQSCAPLDNATVKCWGYNGNGALGLGDTVDRGNGPGEMGDSLPAAIILDADGVIRPDGRIRLAAGFAGNNTYNTTGAGQTKATTVRRLGTATFTASIQNDGDVWDTFTLRGQATTARYRVTYRAGPTDITAAVVAGTYTVANLGPGATRAITIRIKARVGTPVGNSISRTLTTRSTNSPSTRDTVKATVTRR